MTTRPGHYVATPKSDDPCETIADLRLALGWVLGELDEAHEEVRAREAVINQLCRQS